MNGVTISNTGSLSNDAYRQVAPSGDAVLRTTGINRLSGTAYSAAIQLISNAHDAIFHISENDSASTLEASGAYGIVLSAAGRAELIDYGSGVGGLRSVTDMNTGGYGIGASGGTGVKIALKSPVFSGHAAAIHASGPTVDIAIAGGSLSAIDYGISASSAGGSGALVIDNVAAITADTGIRADWGSGAATVTSRGAIDARSIGSGVGIDVSSGGALAISVSGNIGANSFFASGVSSTVNGNLAATRSIGIDAEIQAGTGVVTSGASHNITIHGAGEIYAGGVGIDDSGRSTIVNNGFVDSPGTAIRLSNGGSITNNYAISGGVAIDLDGANAATVDLAEGSSTSGNIRSAGDGGRTIRIAGFLNGGYLSAGNSTDDVTVTRTGTLAGVASLGSGNDSFTWGGGTLAMNIDGGAGTDIFNTALGTGNNAILVVGSQVSGFERYNVTSGSLSLRYATGAITMNVTGEANDESILQLLNASGLTGDIYLNSRARLIGSGSGAFGSGTIYMDNSFVQFGSGGTHTNAINLQSALSTDRASLVSTGGAITLSGSIGRSAGASAQSISFGGADYTLTNATNSWSGATIIGSSATLRGTTSTISGGSVANSGNLVFTQAVDGGFAAGISGTGSVQVDAGSGAQVTLSGTNSYSGATSITAGTLRASGGAAIGDTSAVSVASGTTLQLAASEAVGSLSGAGTTQIEASTLTVGGDNTSTTFSGKITDSTPAVYIGSWTVSDGPAWATNPPTYTGQEAAALLFGGNASDYRLSTAGSSIAAIDDLAWYNVYGATYQGQPAPYVQLAANARTDTGTPGYNNQGDTSAYVQDHTSTIRTNYAFTGGVHLGGGLTKTGTGTLTLGGVNDYTGITAILSGTLAVQNGAAIADTGRVDVASGTNFSVLSSEIIGSLTGTGTTTIAGGSVLTLANASGSYGGNVTGGALTVTAGSWSFGGTRSGGDASAINLNGPAATTLNVAATGAIQGGQYLGVRVSAPGSKITNLGSITSVGTGADFGVAAAIGISGPTGTTTITNGSAGNNTATINGRDSAIVHLAGGAGALVVNNYGVISSNRFDAIAQQGGTGLLTINNYTGGTISSTLGIGISTGSAAMNIVNRGTISGVGYGILGLNSASITLVSSGTISGNIAIALSDGADSVTLEAGSITNGRIDLGAGNDTLVYRGGSVGLIDGGAGTDGFTSDLGLGNSASLSLAKLVGFESHSAQSGNLTLTGTQSGQSGWTLGASSGLTIGTAGQAASWSTSGSSIAFSGGGARIDVVAGSSVTSTNASVVSGSGTGLTLNNAGSMTSTAAGAIQLTGADARIVNSGTITGITASGSFVAAVSGATNSSVENLAGGTITGSRGVTLGSGSTLTNAGTITATHDNAVTLVNGGTVTNQAGGVLNATGTDGAWGILMTGAAGTIVNAGTINAGSGIVTTTSASHSVTNSGTINAGQYGVQAGGGGLTLVNSGDIAAGAMAGVAFAVQGGTLTNSGSIAGGNDANQGFGVFVNGGNATITNLAGGSITGGTGAMALGGGGRIDVDLQAGSTVTGLVRATGSGARNVTIAGTLDGTYDSSASTGVNAITLTATGSIGSASLGAGDDVFVNYGGTITGIIDGGLGTDTLFADFGAGNAGAIGLDHFINFDAFGLLSGDLTLTGASAAPDATIYAGNGTPAGTITFDGTTGLTGDIYVDGGTIRAATEGAFGTGTIHLIDPTAVFGATGTYANNISLEVQTPSTADPATLRAEAGVVATLTGTISQGNAAGVDPAQELVIAGTGTIVLTNAANSWAGTTTINGGATLQGTTASISGASILANGTLAYVQPASGSVAQDIAGIGTVTVSGLAAGQTLTFAGTTAAANGVRVLDGSTVVNGGTLSGANGIALTLANGGAFVNSGIVQNAVVNSGPAAASIINNSIINGVVANTGSGALTFINNAGATVGGASYGVSASAGPLVLVNAGDIAGTTSGIRSTNTATIDNSGRIIGGTLTGGTYTTPTSLAAIEMAGGSINNLSGGVIDGTRGIVSNGALTLANASGATLQGENALDAHGFADITNGGTILSTGAGYAIGLSAGGSIANTGTIQGGTDAQAGFGINSTGALSFVNRAGGTLGGGAGALLSFGAANIDLQAGSTAIGGVQIVGTDASIVRIAGAYSGTMGLGGGNDTLTLVSGLSLGAGTILHGGAGTDRLVIEGAGNGTLDMNTVFAFETRVMNGTGVWTLTGINGTGGVLEINSGTIVSSGNGTIGATSTVSLASGASLQFLANETVGALSGTGNVALGATTLDLVGGTSNFAGVLSGTGGLRIHNGASVTLLGTNNYTGTTLIADGTLVLGASNVLADASALVATNAASVIDLQGNSEIVASLDLTGTLNGTGTLTAATQVLRSAMVNANLGGGALYQLSGTSTLNGAAAAADVQVQAGTLVLGASNRLADTATVLVASGATLDLAGYEDTVGTVGLRGTLAGTGTLSAGQYELTGATVNANLGGGTLLQLGGTSLLNGSAAASQVQVQGGVLQLGASQRLADTATLLVGAGATLDLGGSQETVGVAALRGTLAGTGTLTAGQYELTGATVSANLGGGTLLQLGGTSLLNGSAAADQVQVQGGVLQLGASQRLADTATLRVDAGATLDLGGFEETVGVAAFRGTLAGAGTLTAGQYQLTGATVGANLGTGTLVQLGGTSTLNGQSGASLVSIEEGVLLLGADQRLSDSAIVGLDTGATFSLVGYSETIGALLNGANGGGTLALGAGRLTVGGANSDFGFGGAITGGGSIEKLGSGRMTLIGDFAHTGRIDLTAGSLAFAGSSMGSLRIQGGTLIGQGSLAGNLTVSSGTLSPGGLTGAAQTFGSFSAGSLTVSGGTLAFDVGGRSTGFASDTIRVSGATALSGGTVQIASIGGTSDYLFSQQYVLIQSGTLTGTFANGLNFADVVTDPNLKWRLRYDLVPNAVVLQLQKGVDFADLPGGTPNQQSVANALTGGAGEASDEWSATLNSLGSLSLADRARSFDTLSGEALADLSTSTIMANNLFTDLLRQRIGSGTDGLTGTSYAQSTLAGTRTAATDPMRANLLAAAQDSANADGNGGAVWTQAYGGYQRLKGNIGQATLETTVAGVAMGGELQLGNLAIGVAGGAAQLDAGVDARLSRMDGTLYQAGGYLSYDDGSAFASIAGTWYKGDFDTLRAIAIGTSTGTAQGDADSDGYSIGASIGYRADLGGGTRAAVIASATKTHDTRDAFAERASGGVGLDVAAADRDLFTATGELRLGQVIQTGSGSAMPFVSVGVRYNDGDLASLAGMRFAGAPTGLGAFTVEGARMSRWVGTLGAGIDAKVSDNVSLGVAAESAFADRTREGRASLRIKIGF
ncbi:autotransporter-associated beta strand repeat-containing protein [Sphingomonas sp. LM7]|uniref:autotransporter-associated beta strand repeat-containing protein n=1 Tax=Sphingomonas sp. LM7 TaxID=1938607 RepID=UPI00209B7522|nr:autotransporter-associated beta strand repeat-containing protein [Sphingomonas sp. LM7]